MFTAVPQKNRGVAEKYFDEHLSHNDYYSQGEIKAGQWIGDGVVRLGLQEGQFVRREDFLAACNNLNPATGERLTQRLNSDRRIFFDFTCSAPKSVSIMAVTMNDERIVCAHEAAAQAAFKELEQFSSTRVRKEGAQRDRVTRNLVAASFLHHSSRALDPQLHTHFTVFNCTFDAKEGQWKALQTSGMFSAIHYATEVYRNELAGRLHEIGYEIQKTKDGFEIKGVSPAIIKRFSKRAQERDAVIAKMENELGRKLSNNEISHVIHQTRSRKLKGISTAEVRHRQVEQLGWLEKIALNNVRKAADGRSRPFEHRVDAKEAVGHAIAHVYKRNSVATREQLLHAALVNGCGQLRLDQLKRELEQRQDLIQVGQQYSTRQILETELYLINSMNNGKGAVSPINSSFTPASGLGQDQRRAVEEILKSRDRFSGLRGLAGTGKSTALGQLSAGISAAGWQPVFCAPTAAATDVLRRDGFPATTLQKLLVDPSVNQRVNRQSVIILDEAAAVGIDDMKKVFALAQERDARVILSGDTGQHSSVPRGDALRVLEQHSQYGFSQLTQIRRQKRIDYLKAVELAARQRTKEALEQLERAAAVFEKSREQLYDAAAKAYVDSLEKGRSTLVVSPTWTEIESVTERVRAALKAKGFIGSQEQLVSSVNSLGWTEAQKANVQHYERGQRIHFLRRSGAFAKNETVEVVERNKGGVCVRRQNGLEVNLPAKGGSDHFEVCETRNVKVAPGEKLLLRANRTDLKLINGEVVQVKEIRDGAITLTDGRVLPPGYKQFCHGYAVTSHSAQGRTVDDVIVVAGSRSAGAINSKQFYVSISRGRESCRIFTDDKQLLREQIAASGARTAAVELLEVKNALIDRGLIPRQSHEQQVACKQGKAVDTSAIKSLAPARTRLSTSNWLRQLATAFERWIEQPVRHVRQTLDRRTRVQIEPQKQAQRRGITV